MKVNIPASMSQHCNTYIAFVRLEDTKHHAEIIEKFTDTKFRGYHLLLSWSSSYPIHTAHKPRYFEKAKEQRNDDENEKNETILGLKEQKMRSNEPLKSINKNNKKWKKATNSSPNGSSRTRDGDPFSLRYKTSMFKEE